MTQLIWILIFYVFWDGEFWGGTRVGFNGIKHHAKSSMASEVKVRISGSSRLRQLTRIYFP